MAFLWSVSVALSDAEEWPISSGKRGWLAFLLSFSAARAKHEFVAVTELSVGF